MSILFFSVAACQSGSTAGSVTDDGRGGASGDGGTAGNEQSNGGDGGQGSASTGGAAGNMTGGTGGSAGQGGSVGIGATGGMAGTGGRAQTGGAGGAAQPVGAIPMFVAVGRGGRRIMSCDNGRTWVANTFVSTEDGEHSTFTPKGLAYANGTFVFLSGWGNPSTTWITRNGIDWLEQKHRNGFAGIGVDDGQFVLVGTDQEEGSKDNGSTWTRLTAATTNLGREAAAFDGIWAAGSDGQVRVLRKGSTSWMDLAGCVGNRHGGIGADGGFTAGLGLMLSVGNGGDVCGINIASGAPISASKLNADVRGKPAFVGDAFMIATGDKIFSSTNGTSWTARTLPKNVQIDLVARDGLRTYVGLSLDGKSFFYSDDGITWTRAIAPPGNEMVAVRAGAGLPSALCKLP
jgi:hypothetical protein